MKKIETSDIKKQKTISHTKTKRNKIKKMQITKQMAKTQIKNSNEEQKKIMQET
jgi:hypothetical protein